MFERGQKVVYRNEVYTFLYYTEVTDSFGKCFCVMKRLQDGKLIVRSAKENKVITAGNKSMVDVLERADKD